MMDQYLRMKKGLPEDVLLFFRLGDFYEMFFEDAKEASAILGLTLTKRHGIPMCGVPHHSAEGYIGRLVKGGKRVAIAEQTTIPQPGKLVERELTRVISAGTLADMNLLDSSRHNYIVALYKDKKRFGLACVDHTTGEFSVAQFEHMDLLLDELSRINPSELLVSDEQTDCFPGTHPTLYYDGYTFLPSTAIPNLLNHFRVHSLDGFGCGEMTAALVEQLRGLEIGLVVLAGFLHILTEEMVQAYPNAILNVHPALIPSFCGVGYYGLHVHEKALERGVKVTGATVHFVNEGMDEGPIIAQKAVAVEDDDTPETLQRRVMEQAEWLLLPKAVDDIANGRICVVNGKVKHTNSEN